MTAHIQIEGTSKYYQLEGGFWGIESDEGKRYLPIIFPESLKKDGARVSCSLKIMDGISTMQMWGLPVRITALRKL